MHVVRVGILSEDMTDETRKLLRLLSHANAIVTHQDNKYYAMIFDVAPLSVPASDVWAKATAEVFRENGFNAIAVEV